VPPRPEVQPKRTKRRPTRPRSVEHGQAHSTCGWIFACNRESCQCDRIALKIMAAAWLRFTRNKMPPSAGRLGAEIEVYDELAGDRNIVDLRWCKRPIASSPECGVYQSRTQRIIPVLDHFSVVYHAGFIDIDLHTDGNRRNELLIAGHPDDRSRLIDGSRFHHLRLFPQAAHQRYLSEQASPSGTTYGRSRCPDSQFPAGW